MKLLLALVATLALALGISTSAQAQTSNVLLVAQDSNKLITVFDTADPGLSGAWLSYSSQISTTGTAIENKLFAGLPSGTVLLVRIDSNKTMTVMVVNDPGFFKPGFPLVGQLVYQDASLAGAIGALKDRLYLGL